MIGRIFIDYWLDLDEKLIIDVISANFDFRNILIHSRNQYPVSFK